jgi:hypothetical protein
MLDAVRGLGQGLGTVAAAAGLLSLLCIVIGLVVVGLVTELKTLGYVILGIGMVLLVTSLVVSRRNVAGTMAARQGKYSTNTIVMTVAFVGLIGVLNFVAFDNTFRWDVTSTKQFTLAPRTLEVLEGLPEPVEAVAFYDRDSQEQAEPLKLSDDMLHEFDVRSDKFTYRIVDPDVEPNTARQYGVTGPGQVAFVNTETDEASVAIAAQVISVDQQTGVRSFQANPRLEQAFVTPLLVVTRSEEKDVAFLVGHGERSITFEAEEGGYSQAAAALLEEGYRVTELDLQRQRLVPRGSITEESEGEESNDVSPTLIVVAHPRRDLIGDEIGALNDYLMSGGRILLLLEQDAPETFRQFIGSWGVSLGNGTVLDTAEFVRPDVRTPLVSRHNPQAAASQGLDRTYYPGVSSLIPVSGTLPTVTIGGQRYSPRVFPIEEEPFGSYFLVVGPEGQENPLMSIQGLIRTSDDSWLVNDPARTEPDANTDTKGPFSLGVVVDGFVPLGEEVSSEASADVQRASLIIFGDADFASNRDFTGVSNQDMFVNSVNQLTGDVSLINIRPKPIARREILATPNEFDVIRFTSWFLLPTLMAVGGVIAYWRRR